MTFVIRKRIELGVVGNGYIIYILYTVHYDKNENIAPYDSIVFFMINHLVSVVESGPLRPLQS